MDELEKAAREVYKYSKIAVNQIICMGGESCQPCENREKLAIALDELERVMSGLTTRALDGLTEQQTVEVAQMINNALLSGSA